MRSKPNTQKKTQQKLNHTRHKASELLIHTEDPDCQCNSLSHQHLPGPQPNDR